MLTPATAWAFRKPESVVACRLIFQVEADEISQFDVHVVWYGFYLFKVVCQFSTTVRGTETLYATGTPAPPTPGGN
jgi:hypothetical protein